MNKKVRVAILFGGKSGEHEVSLHSAASVMKALNPDRYEVLPIAINKAGEWIPGRDALPLLEGKLESEKIERISSLLPAVSTKEKKEDRAVLPSFQRQEIDVVFPVLHGTYGEDGTVQGMLEIANIPYVGAGVLASAVGMDKVIAKKIFRDAGLPQGKFTYFFRKDWEKEPEKIEKQIEQEFTYPVFVKPANLGSSVGISKATNSNELKEAIRLAAKYDRKIVIEEFIPAREIEVAVLGNEEPVASLPGEIIASNDFYDYAAKYLDGKSVMEIPASLPEEKIAQIREWAVEAYKAIDCSGLARVDFFYRKDNGEILINEINTMPGFTPFSMYPKMWERTGISYEELIDRLIQLALERYEDKQKSITTLEE